MTDTPSEGRTWYFVRHGETEWNAEKRMQGQWHSSLSANGREHADVNGRWLKTLGIEKVWASPLGRVRETAEIIGKHMPMDPEWDDRLKEWSSGDWSGELYADIAVKRPEEWAAWVADQYVYRPPNGENFEDLEDRADSFFADAANHPARTVAVLAHGFIIRVMVSCMAGLSREDVLSIKQANDVVIRVRETPEGAIIDHFIGGTGPHEGLPLGHQGAA
jgi:broad specificity phosphatase PhoE